MAKKVSLKKLGRFVKEDVEVKSELEYKAFAFDVFGEVLKKTPVDTGRARANWHIKVDSPDYSVKEGASRGTITDLNLEDFPNVYISNGLDYIGELEDGKSRQAPNGIAQPALAAVRSRR